MRSLPSSATYASATRDRQTARRRRIARPAPAAPQQRVGTVEAKADDPVGDGVGACRSLPPTAIPPGGCRASRGEVELAEHVAGRPHSPSRRRRRVEALDRGRAWSRARAASPRPSTASPSTAPSWPGPEPSEPHCPRKSPAGREALHDVGELVGDIRARHPARTRVPRGSAAPPPAPAIEAARV